MTSRANRSQRVYGTPTGTPTPGAVKPQRNRVGSGTEEQRRAAIDADAAAARRGAQELQAKRKVRDANQQPGTKTDLSVFNAAKTIKKKKVDDSLAIDAMSK